MKCPLRTVCDEKTEGSWEREIAFLINLCENLCYIWFRFFHWSFELSIMDKTFTENESLSIGKTS